MTKGDIQPYQEAGSHGMSGGLKYAVNSGTTASINAGEPVQKLAGAAYVTLAATNFPTATLRVVGVAASASTETASATGLVTVVPATNGQIWIIAPKVAATWNTQAKYNALVGSRVLIDLTSTVFSILATDSAGNGCIVEYLDVGLYPGLVAFSWSTLVDYRNV